MVSLTDPRANNFNILRLVAASSVIFSHATDIADGRHDFFQDTIGYSGGWIAVSAFFSISGFLIYRSMVRSQSTRDFLISRSLRIFPGLIVMLILSTTIIGFTLTTLPADSFFARSEPYSYILGNSILYLPQYLLPGVFEDNPLTAVNGSLWTLRFEFTSYILTLLLFLIGAFRGPRAFLAMTVIMLVGYFAVLAFAGVTGRLDELLYDGSGVAKLHRLWFAFFLGILVGRYIDVFRPRAWMVLASGVAAVLLFDTALFLTALVVLITLALFWFAFLQGHWLEPFRRMEDYSYGIYIYAFPVSQAVEHYSPSLSPFTNAVLTFVATLPLAALSWHIIEKPALSLKHRLLMRRQAG